MFLFNIDKLTEKGQIHIDKALEKQYDIGV